MSLTTFNFSEPRCDRRVIAVQMSTRSLAGVRFRQYAQADKATDFGHLIQEENRRNAILPLLES